MNRRLLLLLLALLSAGCRTAPASAPDLQAAPAVQHLIADRLIFGRNIPAGGTVSDADWEEFVRTVVTPRFPDGLSIWEGNGQWLDSRGQLEREKSSVIEVFHRPDPATEAAIAAIAAEYKRRFGQDAVLRVTSSSDVRFY